MSISTHRTPAGRTGPGGRRPAGAATRASEMVRAAGAVLLLGALLVAVPVALFALAGSPLPEQLPNGQQIVDALSRPDDGRLFLSFLGLVGWAGWASFAVGVLLEIPAAVRGRPAFRLPGLGAQQQLAASLVAAAAVLFSPTLTPVLPGGLAAVAVAATTTDRPQPADPVSSPTTNEAGAAGAQDSQVAAPPPVAPEALLYTVQVGDTLWGIAEQQLGDGARYGEIAERNYGRTQPDGQVLDRGHWIEPGWQLVLPAGAATTPVGPAGREVTVQPGDTLSDLTLEHARTADWQPVWQANTGRTQPDGGVFTDPDHLHPGWQLTIPTGTANDPTARAALVPPVPAAPDVPAPAGLRPTPNALAGPAGPDSAGMPTQRDRAAAEPAATAPAASGPAPPPPADSPVAAPAVTAEPGAPAAAGEADGDYQDAASAAAVVAGFIGGGVLLAAGTWGTVLWLRRRRFRQRTLGRTISVTPPELAPMEKALQAAAIAGAADVTWLDTALRSLGRPVDAEADSPCADALPDVLAVRLTPDVLELMLTAPHRDPAPAPWTASEDGLRWSVRRGDDLGVDSRPAADRFAPYPALVTVGHTGAGEHYLIDLERIGALSLTGDRQRCADLARFVAAELAHNRWSDLLQVDVVGFGAELAELNPSRLVHRSAADATGAAAAEARARLQDTAAVLEQNGTDVLTSRVQPDGPGAGWPPHLLLAELGQDSTETDRQQMLSLLDELRAQRSRCAIAVLLVDDSRFEAQTRWHLHVDAAGQLSIPALGVQLTAQQLPATEAADLTALLRSTEHNPDMPMPPGRGGQPWDALADTAGAPLPELVGDQTTEPVSGLTLVTAPPDQGDQSDQGDRGDGSSVLPQPTADLLAATATTAADVLALAPRLSGQVRAQIEDADPQLDADLAAWHDPDSRVAKLTVLGAPALTAHGRTPSPARPDFYTELAVFLTSRPAGATGAQVAAAIWLQPGPPGRARTALSALRGWLGPDPRTGEFYLQTAAATGGVYRLKDVLVDAEMFRRLRLRAVARGAGGLADLQAALELVTGVPLDPDRRGARTGDGYAFLVDTPLQHEYTAMIIDVAHLVATRHLAEGRPELAQRAAHAALRTGARDDVALLDLVAAHDAAGNTAEADRYVSRILTNHDAEIEEDLPPRTYEVLRRRSWLPRDTRAN